MKEIISRNKKYIKYIKYIKPYIKYEIMIFILVLISSIVALANPILLKIIIDRVLILKEVYLLKYVIIAIIIFYIINILISFSNGFSSNYVGQMISLKIRRDMIKHIQRLRLRKVIDSSVGDFISKVSDDVSTISGFLTNTLISTLSDSLNFLASAGLMMFFSMKLSMIAIFIMIIQLIISIKFSKISKNNQEKLREAASDHISFLKYIFTSIKYIKAYQTEKSTERKYFAFLRRLQKLSFKSFYIYFDYGTKMSFVSLIGSVSIFSLGVYEILKGNMTIGALFVFDTISERFYEFGKNLVNLNISLQQVIVACDRVNSIFDLEKENYESGNKIIDGNSLRFQNVTFSYNQNEQNKALDNISFEIENGQTYAFVGESGGGKSTILNLILRYYDINTGQIYIGDNEINNVDLKYLRNKISYVFQDSMVNNETIEENIRFGNKKAAFNDIIRVSQICCADEFIDTFPEKYQTKVGAEGDKLSGGQKQRISIARGILRDANIYIFDEALSNLDKVLEHRIFNNLQEALNGKIQIYVVHNIQLVKNLKNIIVLKNGRIDAIGDHIKLMKESEVYRNLSINGDKRHEKN